MKGAEQHPPLLRTLGLAYYWQSLIEAGRIDSPSAIVTAEGMGKGRVSRIMQSLRLSLERVHEVLEVTRSTQMEQILRQAITLCWERQ